MLILQSTMMATYTIGDLAREFGVTTRTLRHYEDEGLLTPERKGVSRVFTGRDRARLKLALRGKRLGFTLQELKELFHLYDVAKEQPLELGNFLKKLEKRKTLLEQQREDIDVMLHEVEFFAAQCRRLLTHKTDNAEKAA
jgi:DNA-binding transcriptional MerR regulator